MHTWNGQAKLYLLAFSNEHSLQETFWARNEKLIAKSVSLS